MLPGGAARAADEQTRCFPFCDPESAISSPDGSRIYFITGKALVREDWNENYDIYERRNGSVRLITRTTRGWNKRISQIDVNFTDRDRAFPTVIFGTGNSFSPADTDRFGDLYELKQGKVSLITAESRFPGACAAAGCRFGFVDFDPGRSRIYVQSNGQLVSGDTDQDLDLYSIDSSGAKLLSGGPQDGGADSEDIIFGVWPIRQGTGIYFQTEEDLLPEDTDEDIDIYSNTGGDISLFSDWPSESGGSQDYFRISFSGAVPGRMYIRTNYRWLGNPVAGNSHLYLVDPDSQPELIHSSEDYYSEFGGESPDGEIVYFSTVDSLDPLDVDQEGDVYAWHDGNSSLFSTGPRITPAPPYEIDGYNEVVHVSAEGDVLLTSADQLVAADTDWDTDLYRRSGDSTELVSGDAKGRSGTGYLNRLALAKVLDDGERVLFSTDERLSPGDRNEATDLYVRTGKRLILLSGRAPDDYSFDWPDEGPQPDQAISGGRYLFTTNARLNRFDGDISPDTYMFDPDQPAEPRLVSAGRLAITGGPTSYIQEDEPARFSFRQLGPKTKFVCRMDEGKFEPCRSPITYRNLAIYGHTFQVASIGKQGLGLKAAVSRRFVVNQGETRSPRHESAGVYRVGTNSRRVLVGASLRRRDGRTFDGFVLLTPNGNLRVTGKSDDAYFIDADRSLGHIAFSTSQRLAPADDDAQPDLYIWTKSGIELFPSGMNLVDTPQLSALSDNGQEMTFATRSQLVEEDTDQATDVYLLDPDGFRLASPGSAAGLDARPETVAGLDGASTFFTREALVPEDTGDGYSLYWGDGEEVRLVAPLDFEEQQFHSERDPVAVAGSADGRRLVLKTKKQLDPVDDDEYTDIYTWSPESGLVFGSPGLLDYDAVVPPVVGWRKPSVNRSARNFLYTSYLGDLFRNRDGTPEAVRVANSSYGGYAGSSADLDSVAMVSSDNGPGDKNNLSDLFLVRNGESRRLTLALGRGSLSDDRPYRVRWVSDQGTHVLFTTTYRLVPADTDRQTDDIYLWKRGKLRMLSNVWKKAAGERFVRVAAGPYGGNFYIKSRAQIIPQDRDREIDIYRLNDYGIERMSLWPDS